MRGAVGRPAVKIRKAGWPRILTRLGVVLIAAKSNALGRQGIKTRSAASTAALAALSAWGGVSITRNAAPWPVACAILAARRGGRAVDHDRGRILSPCRPLARRRLRVDVDHKGGMPGILGGGGQVQGEGGFPRAALLADDRDCWHVNILT